MNALDWGIETDLKKIFRAGDGEDGWPINLI